MKATESTTPKRYRQGTHRSVGPAETLARVQPLLPSAGITRIANVTGLDYVGLPVVIACRPNSRSISVMQGKGVSLEAAKASAVMEALESYHSETIKLPLQRCSFEELCRTAAVADPMSLPACKASAYNPELEILWIEAEDLLTTGRTWLPYELVHTDYTLPLPTGSGCFAATSSGLASGNNLAEALVHALCEVIERDAVTLWQGLDDAAKEGTSIALDSITDAACREVIDLLRRANLTIDLWESTSDVGVPVCCCHLTGLISTISERFVTATGTGCHPAREIALIRALSEAAQSRLTHIAGSRDDMPMAHYEFANEGRPLEIGFRLPPEMPLRQYADLPTHESETIEDDLEWLLSQLDRAGLTQVLAVDLSQPRFGVAVVRVVIPGMEAAHDIADYVPGRRALARQ